MDILEIKETPLGPITLAAGQQGMKVISFGTLPQLYECYPKLKGEEPMVIWEGDSKKPALVEVAKMELLAYLHGRLREFSLPVDWRGMTPFQESIRRACLAIPYGKTITYTELARRGGYPRAIRAAGAANASNPLPILIPCHRVIGSDGKLHGYGGPKGIETKAWLLSLEQSGSKTP